MPRFIFAALMAVFLCLNSIAGIADGDRPGTVYRTLTVQRWCWSQEAFAAMIEAFKQGSYAAANARFEAAIVAGHCVNMTGIGHVMFVPLSATMTKDAGKQVVVRGSGMRLVMGRPVPVGKPMYVMTGCRVFVKGGPGFCHAGKPTKAPHSLEDPGAPKVEA